MCSSDLLDRIDIHVEVPVISYEQLTQLEKGEPSSGIRERVVRARMIQQQRYREHPGTHCNANMRSKTLHQVCCLEPDAEQILRASMADLNFSARAYDRILKVARTIADLAGTEAPANIDGESLASLVSGGSTPERDSPMYWEYHAFGAMQAVRLGDWKGVRMQARENPDGPIELYDLAADPSESVDLASENPDIVAQIDSVMDARTLSHLSRWNFGDDYSRD